MSDFQATSDSVSNGKVVD